VSRFAMLLLHRHTTTLTAPHSWNTLCSLNCSSFINWYIGEKIQKAAVAIETQGFTFCTSGKKRDTLKGQAIFQHLIPDLQKFAPGIYNGVQTEVSTSKSKCFNLITFIDTPGLVDGSFQYPFPVEDAIVSVAKHTDLIYIFFDPIGQALCDRTMKVIEMLQKEHADKIRYFLSKADTVPDEMDRQKVAVASYPTPSPSTPL
jgi:hypothetical protein